MGEPFRVTDTTTKRGFRTFEFEDYYGCPCRLQESSLATEAALWLGVDREAMHLNEERVRWLVRVLSAWLEAGELPEAVEAKEGDG